MALYQLTSSRSFDGPVLVICLEGWIDAGLGAGTAIASIIGNRPTEQVARWDADELIDHRARRPVLHISDGVATTITWPEVQLLAAADDNGRDLLLLTGPEPDMRWHAFSASVIDLARAFGVRLAVGLGAFPAPVPHTRPVHLVSTAPTSQWANDVGYVAGEIDVPAGIQAVLERELNAAGIAALGIWARVPHYVVSMPYPAAAAALVEGLARIGDLTLVSLELHDAAARTRARIDELIANSEEHKTMVAQLEAQADQESRSGPLGPPGRPLPSGDEIAAELERFLRGEGAQ